MDIGIRQSAGRVISNPLPLSWLGRADAPLTPPAMDIPQLTTVQVKNLQAQLGYALSAWDYNKIGVNNELGRYQFTTATLESYGLLAEGANEHYGTDCVNYRNAWKPVTIRKNSNSFANYIYNVSSLTEFLTSTSSQEHLAYQLILDLYNGLVIINAVKPEDTAEVVAGMIAVAWELGVGTQPTGNNPVGTGAYAWRYYGHGTGNSAYNNGRYAITVLSQ